MERFLGVMLPGQCEEEVLTAGSLSSPETDSGTVRGAAGFCCHLDSALQRTLNGPTRAAWLVDGHSMLNGQLPVEKTTTLIKESKSRSAPGAELQALLLAEREGLNTGKSTCVWVFTDS